MIAYEVDDSNRLVAADGSYAQWLREAMSAVNNFWKNLALRAWLTKP